MVFEKEIIACFRNFFSGIIFFISTTTSYSSDSTICTMDFLKLKIIIGKLWHLMFLTFFKLKIVFNILHINCLLGFCKMTFTIYLIFTSLAGRPGNNSSHSGILGISPQNFLRKSSIHNTFVHQIYGTN